MIEAEARPDWGRAAARSSIITAIGWRAAAAGVTSSPVSGAAAITGPRLADGEGEGEGESLADGSTEALADGPSLGLAHEQLGVGVAGEQPMSTIEQASARPIPQPSRLRPITRRRIADVSIRGSPS